LSGAGTERLPETSSFADVVTGVLEARDGLYIVNAKSEQWLTVAQGCSFLSNNWCPNFQAGSAEVEVDIETGIVQVVRFVVARDIGKAINPVNVEGQLESGVMQGIGCALYDNFSVDENTGRTLTGSLAGYKIPTILLEILEIEAIMVEEPVASGPYGAKGVCESGLVNVVTAIANAVYDATGVRMRSLPITPEGVIEAMEKQ
jgi:CO/xanthine dehydrogenase Mo-binding subunit